MRWPASRNGLALPIGIQRLAGHGGVNGTTNRLGQRLAPGLAKRTFLGRSGRYGLEHRDMPCSVTGATREACLRFASLIDPERPAVLSAGSQIAQAQPHRTARFATRGLRLQASVQLAAGHST